ncbi:HSP20-like chaperone [Suillus clintonianus]|uniref:HSP20-like chaperone n=1 Tax=Suillus clintonianus TaxID=1904413 RepID=UPI001B869DAA|nr:HSP20-like chaperone [Suillus clintonianus]KAG2137911.1 HSP20-like chaperone [Suillus clintonianus]
MSLVRTFYDSFTEFDKLFDDAFNARFRPSPAIEGNTTLTQRRDRAFPRMDLHENTETKTVTASFELPGIKQQDVNIEIHGNRLTVSGESKRSENYEKGGYAVQERSYGKFSRTLQIPQGIQAEDIHAKMENGVLTVCFPKVGPDQQPQRVAIA